MSIANAIHEEKETLTVDVNLPGHDERTTTPLFSKTRTEALVLWGGRCFASNQTEAEAGLPLELHHFFVERSTANAVSVPRLRRYVKNLKALCDRADAFLDANPVLPDIMAFVDNMLVNGVPLTKEFHTGKGTGIHQMPMPLWSLWATGEPGFVFVRGDEIIDADDPAMTTDTITLTVDTAGTVGATVEG